jgi:predicted dinucleotide-binding enzyme
MYVLIGGAGMMGLGLAQRLLELGHTVAIIRPLAKVVAGVLWGLNKSDR